LWAIVAMLTGGDRVLARHAVREARLLPRDTLEGRLATAFSATAAGLLPFLVAPLLGILGSKDRLVRPAHARSLLGRVPFASLVELDAPHLILQTRPAEVWSAISEEFQTAA
jgi:pimeloyl-ACP methyl ester carboxylesterase